MKAKRNTDNLYRPTKADLKKRRGDRRRLALRALYQAAQANKKDGKVLPSHTPSDLAATWKLHPTSTLRVLERLRKQGCVSRTGRGVEAEYQITEGGLKKLAWLDRVAAALKIVDGKAGKVAANPEEE